MAIGRRVAQLIGQVVSQDGRSIRLAARAGAIVAAQIESEEKFGKGGAQSCLRRVIQLAEGIEYSHAAAQRAFTRPGEIIGKAQARRPA